MVNTDDSVVRLIPRQLLTPNTHYTINVSGVQDVAGNTVTPCTRSFRRHLAEHAVNPTFTFVFDHPVDYASLLHNGSTLRNTSGTIVSGVTLNYQLSTAQRTVTITTTSVAGNIGLRPSSSKAARSVTSGPRWQCKMQAEQSYTECQDTSHA